MIVYLLISIALLITLREGLQQRDRVAHTELMSGLWHFVGLIIRVTLITVVYLLTYNLILTLLTGLILTVFYSIACAIGSKQKWYYLSDTGIDGFIKRLLNKLF
jgi:uncharacterized protein involved in cysteine biosynthesis